MAGGSRAQARPPAKRSEADRQGGRASICGKGDILKYSNNSAGVTGSRERRSERAEVGSQTSEISVSLQV